MKNKLLVLLTAASLLITLTACKHGTLATGGAYAPLPVTNAVTGEVTAIQPDFAFYAADASFGLAYGTIDAAFQFEFDNRDMLWKLSPSIKHALDKLRPDAVTVRDSYINARAVYKANPTPDGLSLLQQILQKAQTLAASAAAAVPKK